MISLEFPCPGQIKLGSLMKILRAHFFVLVVLLSLLNSLVAAQSPTSTVVVVDKSGKEASCDGALEIIPRGQVTFARKRYVAPLKHKSKLAKPHSNARR